jgi:hypothetical protein
MNWAEGSGALALASQPGGPPSSKMRTKMSRNTPEKGGKLPKMLLAVRDDRDEVKEDESISGDPNG